ncbi:acetylglutamate kinase [Tunicatimonas pelagia]|uniref:acetylglutamate kinase n=1 Tax=Tunicatimonas pelagia TaxID=931531 RepID=UPI002666911B|nr:acetylglutamate kinase [Tunicatimonas pelagia]WKN42800.1 acetylglutamate kinase [Tunicatimonas pelagia]
MPKLSIVKIGGKVIDDLQSLSEFLTGFSLITGPKILVHGGGASASRLAEQMGIPVQMVDGRRITDANMLKVVVMIYAGWVNKQIVAMLQARKTDALGLTGADQNIIRSIKRPAQPIDFGFVGDVKQVDADRLSKLLNEGTTPVVAPITHDGSGSLLNTNADTIATELAIALTKQYDVRLAFCFEKKGVLANVEDDNSVMPSISQSEYGKMKKQGQVHSGMIPKLDNAYRAINRGVATVKIMHHSDIHRWQPDVSAEKRNFGTSLNNE